MIYRRSDWKGNDRNETRQQRQGGSEIGEGTQWMSMKITSHASL